MFPDHYDVEPFNPFNVGPANSGVRSEFKIPTSVTYPPPVFVAKPEYVEAAAEQTAHRSASQNTLKSAKSKHGGVAISKAIRDEMAVAKQQAAAIHETDRLDDGAGARVKIIQDQRPKEKESKESIRTLLPVRSTRQASGQGNPKGSTSHSSVVSKQRKTSRVDLAPKTSKISNTTLTPKSILKPFEPAKMSFTALKSKVSETATQSSAKSNTKGSSSEQSIRSSDKSDPSSGATDKNTKEAASKESRRTLVSESALSYGKPLTEQAADLAYRLNSGNENFRRYDSVVRNYSTTVPEKLSQGDRMSFWFSDAVLS